MRKSYIPKVNPGTVARIKNLPEDTCFIMEQRQPFDMWNPEDEFDLVPYGIYSSGKEADVCRYWESLNNKIRGAHERESAELFSRAEGVGFSSVTVIKGSEVIIFTVCGKDKALQLAY